MHVVKISFVYLTERELDIVSCIINGRSAKFIASILNISINTVNYHMKNIMRKLNCHTRDQLIDFFESSEQYALIDKKYLQLTFHHNRRSILFE